MNEPGCCRLILAIATAASLSSCCATTGAYEQGVIDAADRASRQWSACLPTCDEAPAGEGEVQLVGHLSDGGSTWQSTALACDAGRRCCNTSNPTSVGIESLDGHFTIIEKAVPPLPFLHLDCEWGPWQTAIKRTTVRVIATRGEHGLRVTAMCKVSTPTTH